MSRFLLLTGLWVIFGVLPAVAENRLDKGKYLFQLANCYSCHTDTENDGKTLAGGRAMETEFGTFYTPNITPDMDTGIGRWSDEEFSQAVRSGITPDGSHYYPTFPYTAYRNISDDDIQAIKAYIFSLEPVKQRNMNHQLKWYVSRPAMLFWKKLNDLLQSDYQPDSSRGAYLINTLGHCNECHTPRNALGILQMDRALKGNEQLSAPDISSKALAQWDDEELSDLLSDGALPDGDYVSDHMAEVVEFSTANWKPEDLKAVIQFLRSE